MSRRATLWFLAFAGIFGLGWYKSYENRSDVQRRADWDRRVQRLQAESSREFTRLVSWLRKIHGKTGSRQEVVTGLPRGQSLVFQEKGERDITSWTHPEYGIRLSLEFEGDRLVGHGASGGNVAAVYPTPERTATASDAESVRKFVTQWGGWMWAACLLAAVASSSYGLVAAEWMLTLTFACGVAWMVSPHYTITFRGIVSNDSLFFAAVMYVVSLTVLAYRAAPLIERSRRTRKIQFRLKTLLTSMGLLAVFLAMGGLGYVAIGSLFAGGLFFTAVVAVILRNRPALSGD